MPRRVARRLTPKWPVSSRPFVAPAQPYAQSASIGSVTATITAPDSIDGVWAKDANDQLVWIETTIDTTGTQTSRILDRPGGTVTAATAPYTNANGPDIQIYSEIYQLDGSSGTATAIAQIRNNIPGVAAQAPTVGQAITITGEYYGYEIETLRGSVQDAQVTIDGFTYSLGAGTVYGTSMPAAGTSHPEILVGDIAITAGTGALLEVRVGRKVP